MKKSLGFSKRVLHLSPRKWPVKSLIAIMPSVPYIKFSSPWLSKMQAKQAEFLWSSSEAASKRCEGWNVKTSPVGPWR